MTFPLVCYCNAVPRPIAAVFRFFHAPALAFVLILCLLGLYEFPYTPEEHAALISGGRRRPNRDGALPETVKQRLPPVEFAVHLAERSRSSTSKRPAPAGRHDDDDDGDASTCRVCLERLELTDEVRPLGQLLPRLPQRLHRPVDRRRRGDVPVVPVQPVASSARGAARQCQGPVQLALPPYVHGGQFCHFGRIRTVDGCSRPIAGCSRSGRLTTEQYLC
uniref:Uncharacterized protein n=1 Tax=Aegilops tauschii TaxID=37682 RepID=M8B765_AEGTA